MARFAYPKTKLPKQCVWREIKRVAGREDPTVLGIPLVVRVTVVGLEPQAVLVVVDVEDVQVAVGVRHKCTGNLPEHHPSTNLRVVSDS